MNTKTTKLDKETERAKQFIHASLISGRFDEDFASLCLEVAKNSKNLPSIIDDINGYPHSKIGMAFRYKLEAIKKIKQYDKALVVTLTNRFDLSGEEIQKKYNNLIRSVSRKLLNNGYKRHEKTILNLGFVEGEKQGKAENKNIPKTHIHAVINCPSHVEMSKLKSLINAYWNKHVGLVGVDGECDGSEEAVGAYISKMKSKKGLVAEAFIQV